MYNYMVTLMSKNAAAISLIKQNDRFETACATHWVCFTTREHLSHVTKGATPRSLDADTQSRCSHPGPLSWMGQLELAELGKSWTKAIINSDHRRKDSTELSRAMNSCDMDRKKALVSMS